MELERARFREAARRHRRCGGNSGLALRDQFALPIQPLQLPDAKRDADQHHRDREQRRRELRPKPAHARGGSWCSRLCLYCSAMSAAFNGRSIRIAPPRISGVHNRRCSQTGGANLISTMAASPTTISPRKRMTNTAGPSPASCADRSSRQAGQLGRTVKRPVKSRPSPQRGQRHANAACATDTGVKWRASAVFTRHGRPGSPRPSPTSKCRQTGTATRRRQSASTRPPPRARNGGPA